MISLFHKNRTKYAEAYVLLHHRIKVESLRAGAALHFYFIPEFLFDFKFGFPFFWKRKQWDLTNIHSHWRTRSADKPHKRIHDSHKLFLSIAQCEIIG